MYLYYNIIVDYYMNTIGDMQNEMDFSYHCNEFEYNHDFEQVFQQIYDALLEYVVLGSNVLITSF